MNRTTLHRVKVAGTVFVLLIAGAWWLGPFFFEGGRLFAFDYPQISLKGKTRNQAATEWVKRVFREPESDGKVRLNFFGRVLDTTGLPVPGTSIHFQWTDLSRTGTSEADTVSGADGRFHLTHQHGKRLEVNVHKDGYYSLRENLRSFEFSNPGEDTMYYEPDRANPVIFRLRKEGVHAKLIKVKKGIEVPGDGTEVSFDLTTGRVSPTGQLKIQTWKPPVVGIHFPYDWRVLFRLEGGGFTEWNEQQDEFGFTAPEAGYLPALDLQLHAINGTHDVITAEHLFFVVGQPPRYGRLFFRTWGQTWRVNVDYVLNETPNDRNLE